VSDACIAAELCDDFTPCWVRVRVGDITICEEHAGEKSEFRKWIDTTARKEPALQLILHDLVSVKKDPLTFIWRSKSFCEDAKKHDKVFRRNLNDYTGEILHITADEFAAADPLFALCVAFGGELHKE
jgi:hypothetical protein